MKLLFVISNLEIGGTRRSLLNLLSYMSNYDVDLYLLTFSPFGAYENMVPPNVNIIIGNKFMQSHFASIKTLRDKKKYMLLLYRAIGSVGKKIFGEDRFWDYILREFASKRIREDFDAIIGFQEGFSNFFTTFTSISPKLIWMHNDYNNIPMYRTRSEEAYVNVDHIFFVAETAKESFAKAYPSLKDRMCVIKNIVPQTEIRKKAKEKIDQDYYKKGKLNLISVGRIEKQKAFGRIIEVLDILGNLSEKINWIIIGEGTQREEIEGIINQRGYQNRVHFVGAKSNPYPYVANSDMFVLTSQYESQPMVIMESLTVGTPVISTNFTSAFELLENQKYGIICENSSEGIATVFKFLLEHRDVIVEMKEHTSDFIYDNDAIINQILKSVENATGKS